MDVGRDTSGGGTSKLHPRLVQRAEMAHIECVIHHTWIAKREQANRTVTTVTPLDGDQRAQELAQMLGGVSPATT